MGGHRHEEPTAKLGACGSGEGSSADAPRTLDLGTPAMQRPRPRPGDAIDRYRLTAVLGVGGMGTVYAAHDPELDREVAIKLTHHVTRDDVDRSAKRQARLVREARAMAQLSHPNVATVFEVGDYDGHVYVAMERIEGDALDDWLKGSRRNWAEILEVFLAAGAGLAAAHEQGLVHRDFKPSNVMVGRGAPARRDAVKVLDFGLARVLDDSESGSSIAGSPTGRGRDLERTGSTSADGPLLRTRLTDDGTVMGTPAYMSAEQLRGLPCDGRADQFAFCVAVFEAIYGRRPFDGSDLSTLTRSVLRGEIGPRPRGAVPHRLWSILRRGLAPRPTQRWPDMRSLLRALHRVHKPRRIVGVVFAGAAALGVLGIASADAAAGPCSRPAEPIVGVWDDTAHERVSESLRETGAPYADATAARVEEQLDAYTARWVELRHDACTAARGSADAAGVLDRRIRCLDARLERVAALVDVLGAADEIIARRAVKTAARLPELGRCSDDEALAAEVSPPGDATAASVQTLRAALARVRARIDAGRLDDAAPAVESAVAQARALGYGPVLADALVERGRLQRERGHYQAAVETLEEAFWAAQEAGADETAAGTAGMASFILSDELAQFGAAQTWLRHGEGALRRLGRPSPRALGVLRSAAGALHEKKGEFDAAVARYEEALYQREMVHGHESHDVAALMMNIGNARLAQGEYEDARDRFSEASRLYRELLGPDHPDNALALANLANARGRLGEHGAALELTLEALRIHRGALGPEHPYVGMTLQNIGTLYERTGRYDEAGKAYEQGLSAIVAAFGDDHPNAAVVLHNLGGIRRLQGRPAEALRHLERAHATFVQALGDEHPKLAASFINLGGALMDLERYDDAIARFTLSRDVARAAFGRAHPDVALAIHMIGNCEMLAGRSKQALVHHREAVEIWERAVGPDHEETGIGLTGIGQSLLALGRPTAALPPLQRAVAILEAGDTAAAERASAQFALAQAIVGTGGNRGEALDLADRALTGFVDAGPVATRHSNDVRTWLAKHGR